MTAITAEERTFRIRYGYLKYQMRHEAFEKYPIIKRSVERYNSGELLPINIKFPINLYIKNRIIGYKYSNGNVIMINKTIDAIKFPERGFSDKWFTNSKPLFGQIGAPIPKIIQYNNPIIGKGYYSMNVAKDGDILIHDYKIVDGMFVLNDWFYSEPPLDNIYLNYGDRIVGYSKNAVYSWEHKDDYFLRHYKTFDANDFETTISTYFNFDKISKITIKQVVKSDTPRWVYTAFEYLNDCISKGLMAYQMCEKNYCTDVLFNEYNNSIPFHSQRPRDDAFPIITFSGRMVKCNTIGNGDFLFFTDFQKIAYYIFGCVQFDSKTYILMESNIFDGKRHGIVKYLSSFKITVRNTYRKEVPDGIKEKAIPLVQELRYKIEILADDFYYQRYAIYGNYVAEDDYYKYIKLLTDALYQRLNFPDALILIITEYTM